ncbi:hypothetical protein GCM10007989_03960 [Devosia pacifica]|uniref:DoxX family protein n=1 Tax=Devosia pacifica TaxID=1335967 RepID=A0A918VMA7_9HYPH|nr:hypothetical protein GCM10007989_03960 [Devosia pacifica]
MFERLTPHAPKALAVLRIITGLLFLEHGTQKLFAFPPTEGTPPLMSIFGAAGVIELITGVLVVLGFFTRPAAFWPLVQWRLLTGWCTRRAAFIQ